MTDDIIDHLSFAVCNEGARPAGLIVNAIEEIERLRAEREIVGAPRQLFSIPRFTTRLRLLRR